eukprot:g19957.t1
MSRERRRTTAETRAVAAEAEAAAAASAAQEATEAAIAAGNDNDGAVTAAQRAAVRAAVDAATAAAAAADSFDDGDNSENSDASSDVRVEPTYESATELPTSFIWAIPATVTNRDDILAWHRYNRMLGTFLSMCTTGAAKKLVATFKPKLDMMFNGIAAWKALVRKYRNPSCPRQKILFKKLYNMTMDVEQDPDAFMHDMTELRDELQLLESPIPDEQFLNIILDCLSEQLYSGTKYEPETKEDLTLEQTLYTMRNLYINRKEESGTSRATKRPVIGNDHNNSIIKRGQNRNGCDSFNSNAPAGQHQHNSNNQANYGQTPVAPLSTTLVEYYNRAEQQAPGSATTALAAPAPPSGVGFSFVANSTVPAPAFTMTVDTGASSHFLDSELLPDLEQRMIECTKIGPPVRITVAGQGQLPGTAKGVLKVIVTDQYGTRIPSAFRSSACPT